MTHIPGIQQLRMGALQRPAEQRLFNEGAGAATNRITAVVLSVIAAIVSFVILPWQAALGVTAVVTILASLCCCRNRRIEHLARPLEQLGEPAGVVYGEPDPVILRRPWYQRMWAPVFTRWRREAHVVDPRPREGVGVGAMPHARADRRRFDAADPHWRAARDGRVVRRDIPAPRPAYDGGAPIVPPPAAAERERAGAGIGRRAPDHAAHRYGGAPAPAYAAPAPMPRHAAPAPAPMHRPAAPAGGVDREVVGRGRR